MINWKRAYGQKCSIDSYYNERKTIEKIIKDWKRELPNSVVYVFDNNSINGTDEMVKGRCVC